MIKIVEVMKTKLANSNGMTDEIYNSFTKLEKSIESKSNISDVESKFTEFNNSIDSKSNI